MPTLPELLTEAGIRVPENYDKACLRCGKPAGVRGDAEGLCLDCHDECEFTEAGFEGAVRAELKGGRWHIRSGENHWRNSLLQDIPPEILKGMGVDCESERPSPVPVFIAISHPAGFVGPARCLKCERTLESPLKHILLQSAGIEKLISYYLCPSCDAYAARVCRDLGREGLESRLRGPLPRSEGDLDLEKMGLCGEPWNKNCSCSAHRHFARLYE